MGGVADYGAPITARGLSFMDTPGYDPSSVTGLIAGWRQHRLLHHRPRLGLRIETRTDPEAGNDDRALRAHAGRHGHQCRPHPRRHRDRGDDGRIILDAVIAAASGTPTRSEENGYGDEEFAPWSVGAVL